VEGISLTLPTRGTIDRVSGQLEGQSVFVARVQDGDMKSALSVALEGIGGVNLHPNIKIIIKPNLCTFMGPETGATTDLELVDALIELLNDLEPTCEIAVVESRSLSGSASDKFNRLGYTELEMKYKNVKLVDLDREHVYTIGDARYPGGLKVPEIFLLSEYFVSVPKLKTSDQQKITCVLKNQFGCMPGRKQQYHPWLSQVIADVNDLFIPDLCSVDGVVAMEGRGPTMGRPKRMNLIIVGKDPVATDSVAARVMGIVPGTIPSLKKAANSRIGRMDGMRIAGADIADVSEEFERIPWHIFVGFRIEDSLKRMGYNVTRLGKLVHVMEAFLYERKKYWTAIKKLSIPEIMMRIRGFQEDPA